MEPPEEFYDSLDEDSNYGSLDNESVSDEQLEFLNSENIEEDQYGEAVLLHFSQANIPPHVSETDTKDDVIPFYDKDLNRSEMESINDAECSRNKSKKDFAGRKLNVPFVDDKMKSKSYLHMFHAKIGTEISKTKSSAESSKATCLGETPKSFVTCQDFEVNSMYLKSEDFSEAESSNDSPFQNNDNNKQDCVSVSSLDSKFYSVSEQCLNLHSADTTKSKKKCSKSFAEKVPLLGGLGPEIPKDKLDLLKRRQQYGLKASQKNRIKMIEKRLLENLQREMKECGNINV